LTSHRAIPDHTYHFSHFILFTSLSFVIFECTDSRRDCTSFHGKKGLKAPRECSWKKIKAKTITFQMLAQGGLENDETFLLKICYPRYLGITRRSCLEAHMVLDMEYREQERPEHGPGGPIFFFSASFVLPAVPASITTGLGLHQKRLLLHEVIGLRYHGMCHI
jgi:hypothetical protein